MTLNRSDSRMADGLGVVGPVWRGRERRGGEREIEEREEDERNEIFLSFSLKYIQSKLAPIAKCPSRFTPLISTIHI